jgi:hypothetical protein
MLNSQGILEEIVKRTRSLLILSLTIACFLLAGTAAKADSLSIVLSAPYQVVDMGDTTVVAFDGTITNISGVTEYLNGDNTYVDSPLVFDDSPFLNDAPLTLGAGGSYSGLLFNIDIPQGTPEALYTGSFQILGGPDNSSELSPMESPVDFDVQITPEPTSFLLFGTGLIVLARIARKRFV